MRRGLLLLEKLVIVESPNKVIKVEGLLSDPKVIPDWSFRQDSLKKISVGPEKAIAMATTGHFMALKELTWTPQPLRGRPLDASDFPENGVMASFALEWEIIPGRRIQDTVSHYVEEKAGDLTEIIIATDPDREGELIAVHALSLIRRMFPKLAVPFTRAYMHSITEDGIRNAMKERRELFDHNLANAAEARHAMDRIFGFLGSSVVRFANPQMRSIGRVQTPALILIKEREDKIAQFLAKHKTTYEVRSVCTFPAKNGTRFSQLVSVVPAGKNAGEVQWENEAAVKRLAEQWSLEDCHGFRVVGSPVSQTTTSEPPQPFTMATLIAKANRQLHLSSESVSSCLQDLFQMGHITYPRTDSTRVDDTALPAVYEAVRKEFGKTAVYRLEDRAGAGDSKKKGKKPTKKSDEAAGSNVEDAHEAIRPTDINVTVEQLGSSIAANTKQVYDLIRRNTLASFMIPMKTQRVAVTVGFTSGDNESLEVQLEGKHTMEPGWSQAFRQGSSKASAAAAESELDAEEVEKGAVVVPRISGEEYRALMELKDTLSSGKSQQSGVSLESPQVQEKRPSPPLPYSEGGLIEELKNNGVGRPSTYPMIVKTLLARNYITVNDGRCETTPVGRLLVETSRTTFPSIVDIGFTSSFEKKLDRIAKPESSDNEYLKQYKNLSEADYVLSSFVSNFLNYVTEATKTQRANIVARSLTLKHEQDQEQKGGSVSVSDSEFRDNIDRERQKAMAIVPDLLDTSQKFRTFTALQNCLNDYLRRNFPPAPPSLWASAGGSSSFSGGGSSSSSSSSYSSSRRSSSRYSPSSRSTSRRSTSTKKAKRSSK